MKFNISHDLSSLCSPETELLPQEKFILVVWPKEYFVLLLPRTVTKSLGCRSQSRLLPRSDRHWGSSVNICLAPEQMNRWAHKGTTLPLMDYAKISSAASSSADERTWKRAHLPTVTQQSTEMSLSGSHPCHAEPCLFSAGELHAGSFRASSRAEHHWMCIVLGICSMQSKQQTKCLRLLWLWWSHLWEQYLSVLQQRVSLPHTWTTKSWWFCTGARMQKYYARYWIKGVTSTCKLQNLTLSVDTWVENLSYLQLSSPLYPRGYHRQQCLAVHQSPAYS